MRASIKLKLASAFGFIILMLLVTAGYGIFSLGNLNNTLEQVIQGPATRLKLTQTLNAEQLQQLRQQKNLLLASEQADMRRYIESNDTARKAFDDSFQMVQARATEQGKVYWDKLAGMTTEFRKQDDRIRTLMLAGDTVGANQVSSNEARVVINQIDTLLHEVIKLEEGRLQAADEQADVDYIQTRTIMISVAAAAFLIAALAALWIAMSINKGLRNAVTAVQNVAEGDLTRFATISSKDEIATC